MEPQLSRNSRRSESGSSPLPPLTISPPAPRADPLQTVKPTAQNAPSVPVKEKEDRRSIVQRFKDFGLPGTAVAAVTVGFAIMSKVAASAAEVSGNSVLPVVAVGTTVGVVLALGKYISAAEHGARWIRQQDILTAVGEAGVGGIVGATATLGTLNVLEKLQGAGSTASAIYGAIAAVGAVYCGARLFLNNPIRQLFGKKKAEEGE